MSQPKHRTEILRSFFEIGQTGLNIGPTKWIFRTINPIFSCLKWTNIQVLKNDICKRLAWLVLDKDMHFGIFKNHINWLGLLLGYTWAFDCKQPCIGSTLFDKAALYWASGFRSLDSFGIFETLVFPPCTPRRDYRQLASRCIYLLPV